MPHPGFDGALTQRKTGAANEGRRVRDDNVETANHLSLRVIGPKDVVDRVQIAALPRQIPLSVVLAKTFTGAVEAGDHETFDAVLGQSTHDAITGSPATHEPTTTAAKVIVGGPTRRWYQADGGSVGEDGGVRQRVSVDKRFIDFKEGLVARGADPRGAPTKFGPDARHGPGTRVPQWLLLLLLRLLRGVTWKSVAMTAVVVVRKMRRWLMMVLQISRV